MCNNFLLFSKYSMFVLALILSLLVETHGITAKTYSNTDCTGKPANIATLKVSNQNAHVTELLS